MSYTPKQGLITAKIPATWELLIAIETEDHPPILTDLDMIIHSYEYFYYFDKIETELTEDGAYRTLGRDPYGNL